MAMTAMITPSSKQDDSNSHLAPTPKCFHCKSPPPKLNLSIPCRIGKGASKEGRSFQFSSVSLVLLFLCFRVFTHGLLIMLFEFYDCTPLVSSFCSCSSSSLPREISLGSALAGASGGQRFAATKLGMSAKSPSASSPSIPATDDGDAIDEADEEEEEWWCNRR